MSENIQIKHSTIPEHIIKHNKVDPEQILLEELTKKYGQRFIDYRKIQKISEDKDHNTNYNYPMTVVLELVADVI